MKTIICTLLDESGSMELKKAEAIQGYNEFIAEQLKLKGEAKMCLVKFNWNVNVVYSNVDLNNVPQLDQMTYIPYGGTALYDAISQGIKTASQHKASDDKVIVVIITDGIEADSKNTSKEQVKRLITDHLNTGDWSFIYIGNDAQQFAAEMAIPTMNVANFCHEKGKIKANFAIANTVVGGIRSNKMKAPKNINP